MARPPARVKLGYGARQITISQALPELIYEQAAIARVLTLEVELRAGTDLERIEGLVEETCRSRGLRLTVKRSLVSYPGSTHWHFKKGKERGTLEVTFWKQEKRLWFSIHANRAGSWTTVESGELKSVLESKFNQRARH